MSAFLLSRINDLLRQRDGQFTRELILKPGGFGLGQIPARSTPDAITSMVCGFCSTGCSLNVHLQDGQAVSLTPATDYPVNLGMACPKGWEALRVLESDDRASVPLARSSRGSLEPVTWPAALKLFTGRFKALQAAYGPGSVAFLGTGQMPTEELAFLGALAKFGMGLIHGDGNTRQCMATSVVAYKQSFGFDAPPYSYKDLEESDVLVFVGANPCIAHPILWERVMRNPHRPEIVVLDPRRTETAMQATLHLPLRPKSDLPLLYGVANILIREGWICPDYIETHTTGFDAFSRQVAEFTPERVAAETGLAETQVVDFARRIHTGQRVSFWWTMGVNQSHQGVRTAQALINLALMTGNIGRAGTGPNSITGQCNAMGSRLFSNTTNLLGGHDFLNAGHRRKVAGQLEIPEDRIPAQNSWAYPEIVEGILRGKIRGLWVVATNPAHSWINQLQLRDVLARLDFLVVQDMYHSTETARLADLVLPAAGWGEKQGTFINSERRIGVISKVAHAPGQALADFSIFRLIAEAWGCADLFRKWTSPEAVFQILTKLTAGQPCDITGIRDYQMLQDARGIQWPFPAQGANPAPERRLFEDGRFHHPDGRAKFVFDAPHPLPEPVSPAYPLVLLTGRGSVAQWHTQTRTAKSPLLRSLAAEKAFVEVNPADARELGISSHEWVAVESQRGRMQARAFVTPTVAPGQVYIPMHYAKTNHLTDAVFDPHSRQPAYKACAVRIVRATAEDGRARETG